MFYPQANRSDKLDKESKILLYLFGIILHRPKRKMRQTFYKKIKNRSVNLFGDINALLKSIILFDDYNQLRL